MKKRVIFITGGTCSSIGKGVTLASIGRLLESSGFSTRVVKIDPYLNQDAGTMNPQEHGEVWVTKLGKEADLDGGTYLRFLNHDESNHLLITCGNILQEVFNRERDGVYQGETVRFHPHVTNEIKRRILENNDKDFTLVEIGGTIGEIELNPFLMAIRHMQQDNELQVMHLNLAMTIYLPSNNEVKIKPLEILYSMLPYGIRVDLQFVRVPRPLTSKEINKIRSYSYVENIIALENVNSIYEVPLLLEKLNVHNIIMEYFQVEPLKKHMDLSAFHKVIQVQNNTNAKVIKALILGKYGSNIDSYKSIDEALMHAANHFSAKVETSVFDIAQPSENLKNYDLVVVAGGFGVNFKEEIINHLRYLRQNNIPTLLICFGLQLSLIEMARNLLKISNATSAEFDSEGTPIICLVDEKHNPKTQNFGGTLRTGEFDTYLNSTSLLTPFYEELKLIENHIVKEKYRHRYWINKNFKKQFEEKGIHFSYTGVNAKDDLFGFELDSHVHQYFVGVQFHPELSSTIFNPHPVFIAPMEIILRHK